MNQGREITVVHYFVVVVVICDTQYATIECASKVVLLPQAPVNSNLHLNIALDIDFNIIRYRVLTHCSNRLFTICMYQ